MAKLQKLKETLLLEFPRFNGKLTEGYQELTLELDPGESFETLKQLQHHELFSFDTLIDVCGVDYLHYGESDWETDSASTTGFSRATERDAPPAHPWTKPRFAVVYHVLSTSLNHRLRVKVFLEEAHPVVRSVHEIWPAANWFEREAYDLFGILFDNHPDLRRILTDYGFIGHPFRKDFPLSGHVEVRYDATLGRVIYEPVQIEPRVTVPRVIRHDSRYLGDEEVMP
ncbi:MAG: NADH-quinone oxidoreductase subunit C [Gammaproteobacteria bacterium]|nr:NADH-quinone oxidoreductase subunit C [Gammaproteobacteria bacterium]